MIGRVYREVSRVYYDEYLALPKYRGFTGDEAREIDRLWPDVRNLASELVGGRAPTTGALVAAYEQVVDDDVPEQVAQGIRLRIMGRLRQTPERERFRREHPEIDLFFGVGRLTPRQQEALLEMARRQQRLHEDDAVMKLLADGGVPVEVEIGQPTGDAAQQYLERLRQAAGAR